MKVTYIDHCGTDLSVVNSARVSHHKNSVWSRNISDAGVELSDPVLCRPDENLIKYLTKHNHKSPFNHTFITIHVKAPIFVARQMVKHRFMPFNEVSRRYVDSAPEFYEPEVWRKRNPDVKQGSLDIAVEIDSLIREVRGSRLDFSITNKKFTNWKHGAKRRGKEFTLSYEDIPWVTHCPILGCELDYNVQGHGNNSFNSPSLDRIDNDKGYIRDNVELVSSLANTMKNSANPKQLTAFIKGMSTRYGVFGGKTIKDHHNNSMRAYQGLLDQGVCQEQARIVLPVSLYTEWYWSGTLGAWADMYNLRIDAHSQWETREIARMSGDIISPLFPVAWESLTT